jgi:ribose 5-phosphate isomerase B
VEQIIIGSDHAGFVMKEHIKKELEKRGVTYRDAGTFSEERCDYPLYSAKVAKAVSAGEFERGILVCGSGIGASITANRFRKVRAALCITPEMAKLSRSHNNANILVLAGRLTPFDEADKILCLWLETGFDGGRHLDRINMIDEVTF